jgi:hypothetical protein
MPRTSGIEIQEYLTGVSSAQRTGKRQERRGHEDFSFTNQQSKLALDHLKLCHIFYAA